LIFYKEHFIKKFLFSIFPLIIGFSIFAQEPPVIDLNTSTSPLEHFWIAKLMASGNDID
jgi:hypothetical protein